MRVLDIGCGWGGAAAYAAERYQVKVTGVTVSRNQAAAARERCRQLPVEIRFEDYRSLTGRFDRKAVDDSSSVAFARRSRVLSTGSARPEAIRRLERQARLRAQSRLLRTDARRA